METARDPASLNLAAPGADPGLKGHPEARTLAVIIAASLPIVLGAG